MSLRYRHETSTVDGETVEETLIIDVLACPFEDGDTIDRYARRHLAAAGFDGPIDSISVDVSRIDSTPYGDVFYRTVEEAETVRVVFNRRIPPVRGDQNE